MNKNLQMKIGPIFTILEKAIISFPAKLKLLKNLGVFLKHNADSFPSIRTGAAGNGHFGLPVTRKTEGLRWGAEVQAPKPTRRCTHEPDWESRGFCCPVQKVHITIRFKIRQLELRFEISFLNHSQFLGIMLCVLLLQSIPISPPNSLVGAARSGPVLVGITIIISGCNMISAWIWFITFKKEMKGKGSSFVYYGYSEKH